MLLRVLVEEEEEVDTNSDVAEKGGKFRFHLSFVCQQLSPATTSCKSIWDS